MITLIAATDSELGIGNANNELLFHFPKDMKHFKEKTTGKKCIFGRTTFESLPVRPLPNRETYVLTTNKDYTYEGVKVVHNIKDVLRLGKSYDIWVCGGEKVYEQLMPYADRLILTHIHVIDRSATTFFPDISVNDWKLIKTEKHEADDKHKYSFVFAEYMRKKNTNKK